ncbi:MAG: hypothetical protein ACJASP_001451 [Roseivirga sp.]|jgi:hypothetical protein
MKVRFRWLAFSILFLTLAQATKAQKATETTQTVYQLLDEYSPESAALIRLLYQLPSSFEYPTVNINLSKEQPIDVWIPDKSEKGIIASLNTVVHESMHGLTSRLPYELIKKGDGLAYQMNEDYSAFYVNEEAVFLVKHSPVFNSNKISGQIPKAIRTFRFKPYIAPKSSSLGSQVNGIYGLMDEWNAYYFGTKASYDLYNYFKPKSDTNYEAFLAHVSDLAGTYFAFYEFKYFILKYLEYAKASQKPVYDGIMANSELRKAYNSIHDRYSALLLKIEARLDQIAVVPTTNTRDSVYRKDGYYFINETGVGLFLEEVNLLKGALDKPELKKIEADFRFK